MASKKDLKKKKMIRIAMIALPIVLILIIGGIFLVTRDKDNGKNPNSTPTPVPGKPVEEKTVDIPLNNEEVLALPSIVGSFTTKNTYAMADEFYKEEVVDILALSIQKQLTIAFVGMPSSKVQTGEAGQKYILESDLQEAFKSAFGNRVKYEAKDFSNFKYNADKKQYLFNDGVQGSTCGGSFAKTISAKKTTGGMEKIEIIEVVGFFSCASEGKSVALYKDFAKKEMVADNVSEDNASELLEQHSKELSQYRYTFVKDDSGKYVFIKTDKM